MDARLLTAAVAAAGCAWLMPAPAYAQISRPEFRIDARTVMTTTASPRRSTFALPVVRQWPSDQPRGMMRSWELDSGGHVGLGRFDITPIARPRTNLEREPMPLERRASSVAGAGLRLAF